LTKADAARILYLWAAHSVSPETVQAPYQPVTKRY